MLIALNHFNLCHDIACNEDQATCSNGQCISRSGLCDGRADCSDGSDENNCGARTGGGINNYLNFEKY